MQRVITDLAVVDITPDGLSLAELAPGVGADDVRTATGADLLVPAHLEAPAGV
ncbi:CoA transferase subunit B [Streptomyces hirsutus]